MKPKVGHTRECEKANRWYEEQRQAFTTKYPDYCMTCGGWGMDEVDLCPDCLEKELCPRCGQPTLDEGGERCGFCGWEYGQSEGLPEPPGCLCPDVYLFDDDWEV